MRLASIQLHPCVLFKCLVVERFSTRQLILHRISPSVCLCPCHTSGMQSTPSYSIMLNSSYACHTPGQVPAYMQCTCTFGHWCSNRMNSDDRVRLDVLLPLGKGSRGRKTVVILKGSMNFNFGRRLSQFTYWLRLPPSTFTCLAMAFSHNLDTACTVQVPMEYTMYHHFMCFVYYSVMTCTNIYSTPPTPTCAYVKHSLRYSYI